MSTVRKFGFVFLLALCACVYAENQDILILKETSQPQTASNEDEPILAEEQTDVSNQTFLFFYDRWRAFQSAFSTGNSAKAEAVLRQIIKVRNRNSIPRIPELAVSAVEYGNLEFSRGRKDQALKLYQIAADLDPSLPYAYYHQARVYLAEGVGGLRPALSIGVLGVFVPTRAYTGKLQFYAKYTLILLASLLVLTLIFATILLLKYNTLLRHDAIERFGSWKHPLYIELMVWILLFAPLLLFWGPLWLAPFWIAIFFGYARTAEKIIGLLLIAVCFVAYPVYHRISQLSVSSADPGIAPYITAFSEGSSPKAITDFEKYAIAHPSDKDGSIMLAYLYKNDLRLDPAVLLLQKHILDYPSDARGYNNLANIYFAKGELDSALRLAQTAARLDRGNAAYPYNLSKLQRAKFNFSEAERLLSDARALDPALIQSFEADPQERLVDATPSHHVVWERMEAKAGPFSFRNPFTIFAAAMFALALIFNFALRKGDQFAKGCSKCGKPFCKKCQSNMKVFGYCTQCLHLFVKKDGISPASRREKMHQIDRHSRRQSLYLGIGSLLVPGAISVYTERTFVGTLTMLAWLLLISILVFNSKFSNLSYFEPSDSLTVIKILCGVFLVLIYLAANIQRFRGARRHIAVSS